jgi:hypothetical protein
MPFAVFRRHQKKLIAAFGILAMLAFVLSDTLSRVGRENSGKYGNRVIVDLYGKPVYRSDLEMLAQQRGLANQFLAVAFGEPQAFGGLNTRDLVDALILKHEADRLQIPETSEFGREWLRSTWARVHPNTPMDRRIFESLLLQLGPDTGSERLLASIASQVRLFEARRLLGQPVVTPLDVFEAYREQNERSSFRVVSFPAGNFLDKVGEPSSAEVESLYEKYKDVLPEADSPTPGFKIPRQVKLEVLSLDGNAVAKAIQDKLTEAELKAYYESRKDDFTRPNELPTDVFAGDEKAALTPPQYIPFAEVKDALAAALAREKAQEQISDKLAKFRDESLDEFSNRYQDAVSENADAKKNGEPERMTVPTPTSLAEAAKANGLEHEVTPLLSKDEAKAYGQIGNASIGLNPSQTRDVKFADEVFAPKSPLFEGMEFNEPGGRRYLVRKLEDIEPHVAPLSEIKPRVIAASKLEKARGLAEKAAKELAETIKKDGGKFKDQIVAGRPVIAIEGATKLVPGIAPPDRPFQQGPPKKADLAQIPKASDSLRDDLFGLKPGEVAVNVDLPKLTYYVMTLDHRDPAPFSGLYGFSALPFAYQNDAYRKAILADDEQRMTTLRAKAGLKADWTPPDEKDREDPERSG